MSAYIEVEYRTPEWFRPRYHLKYIVKEQRAKKCRELYGWGTSAFYSCLANDPDTKIVRIE